MWRRLRPTLTLLLLLLALGLLIYGLYQGDARLVLDNAAAFCFT